MKRTILLFAYCLLPIAFVTLSVDEGVSQDFTPPKTPDPAKDKPPFWSWSRVYGGGGLGLQFGTFTLINSAPDIGYKITDRLSAGVGIRYIYMADKRVIPIYEMNVYGGSVFSRLLLTDFLFAHAEYEVLNGPFGYYTNERTNLTNVWVGGGFRQHSGNVSLNIMGLWNLNDTPNNPFPNPQLRIGMTVGI